MDDSRLVLQPPAEVSDSGQILQQKSLSEASSKHFDEHRARLIMAQLIFAARDLAESRFNRPTGQKGRRGDDGTYQLCCVDCYTFQSDPDRTLDHLRGCPTGRVLRLIDELMGVARAADQAAVDECLDAVAKGGAQ